MTKAIRFDAFGGAENLRYTEIDLPPLKPNEARVRHTAIGLNFIDVYMRTGLYPLPLPSGLGLEAAGVVEEVGAEVSDLKPGDRVAYASGPVGTYSQMHNVPAANLAKVPDGISDETAACIMLKGMTAHYLLRRIYPVKAGDTIVFHAAAGGVGLIACQWANALGATVIGTVGSEEKAELARAHGCHHPVLYRTENLGTRVKEITGGKGVPVVYDSVGASTFESSLDCLAKRGLLVSFGNASGPPPKVDLIDLSKRGSLFVTRPRLVDYTGTREELVTGAEAIFEMVLSGKVRIEIGQRFSLAEAADAHRALEGRQTVGATVMMP